MKKLFNYRPLVSAMIFLIIGIACAILFGGLGSIYFLLFISICISVLFTIKIFIKFNSTIFRRVMCDIIFIIVGVLVCFISMINFNNSSIYYSFKGRVANFSELKNGNYMINLENVSLSKDSITFENCDGNIVLYVSKDCVEKDYFVGTILNGKAKVRPVTFDEVIKNSYYYKNNFKYVANVNKTPAVESFGKKSFTENFKDEIKEKLYNNCDENEASVLYAMIVGDTSFLDTSTKELFSKNGISHILAVSGLHFGFISLILIWIFKKLKANKFIIFMSVSFILFVYACICGFTPSVLRALIMTMVSLFAIMIKKSYDGFSSLAFSAIIILFFKPLYILDIGFILSFATVFAIFSLMPIINDWILKIFKTKLSSAISLAVATQIISVPLCIYFFNTFSIYSTLVNIILVPISCIGFLFAFIICLISFVFPFAEVLLCIPNLIFMFMNKISIFCVNLPFSVLNVNIKLFMIIPFILSLIFIGEFSFLDKKYKKYAFYVGLLIMLLGVFLIN